MAFVKTEITSTELPDIEHMKSKRRHDALVKTALDTINENPELHTVLASRATADASNAMMDAIDDAAMQLIADLRTQGLVLCKNLARVWVCEELEKQVRAINNFYAGSALANCESKSNVCRAANISPAAFAKHWTEAEKIQQATDEATRTGEPVSTTLGGQPFDVYPPTSPDDQ